MAHSPCQVLPAPGCVPQQSPVGDSVPQGRAQHTEGLHITAPVPEITEEKRELWTWDTLSAQVPEPQAVEASCCGRAHWGGDR